MLRAGAVYSSDVKPSLDLSCFHIASIDFTAAADVACAHQTPAQQFSDMARRA